METDGHHAHQWCNGAIMADPVGPTEKEKQQHKIV